jgi:hypothetical protein
MFKSSMQEWRLNNLLKTAAEDPRQHATTPDAVFKQIQNSTGCLFTLDAAANQSNHKAKKWIGPGGIGEQFHTTSWQFESVFLNPPFCLSGLALEKAWYEYEVNEVHSVLLMHAKTAHRVFSTIDKTKLSIGLFSRRVEYNPAPGIKFSSPRIDSMLIVFDGLGRTFFAGEGGGDPPIRYR